MNELKESLREYRKSQQQEVEITPVVEAPVPAVEHSATLSRQQLKKSLAIYREELLNKEEVVKFVTSPKVVSNILADHSKNSHNKNKLSSKQVKSRQVSNMKKSPLLAGLFKIKI